MFNKFFNLMYNLHFAQCNFDSIGFMHFPTGKMFGLENNYYIAEVDYREGGLEEEEEEEVRY